MRTYTESKEFESKKAAQHAIKHRVFVKRLSRDQWVCTSSGARLYVNGKFQIVHSY